jgi:streptogramin lyase
MAIGGKVTLLADNQVAAFTATSEVTNFEATNLTDGNGTTIWKPTGFTDQTLTYDKGVLLLSSFATSAFDAGATGIQGISYAANGTLWACDSTTDKIYNMSTTGTLASSFLTSVFDAAATSPTGVSYAPDGTLWVVDSASDKVYNVTVAGVLISSFAVATFDTLAVSLAGISYAENGTLWLIDDSTLKVYNVTVAGALISEFQIALTVPTDISYASDGTLWLSDTNTDKIYNMDTAGTILSSFDTSVYDATATITTGISSAPDGTLWVCDDNANKVYNVNEPLSFDSLFISGHNLNTVDASILWQYSDDGAAWTDINYLFPAIDDKAIGIRLSAMRSTRAVRVKLSTMTALPYVSILIITKQAQIDYANLHDPHRTKKIRKVNKTIHGQVSDITNYYEERILALTFDNEDMYEYKKVRDYFDGQGDDVVGVYWEPDLHKNDCWPMSLDSDEINSPFVVSGVLRNVTIQLRGVKE